MQTIKLIALDLDGTTLTEEKELTLRTERVLREAAKRGSHLVVASGRAYTSLPKEVMALPGITYALTSNGSAVYDPKTGERVFEFLMKAETVDQILELLEENPEQEAEVFYKGMPHVSERFMADPVRYGAPQSAVPYLQTTRTAVKDLLAFAREHRHELDAIDIIRVGEEERASWFARLEKMESLYITSSVPYRIELSGADSGKGAALRAIAGKLGILPEEIVAFGNADNDMDMMEFAGLGVAVANSPKHVREMADRVVPSNDEEGVAQMLEELLEL